MRALSAAASLLVGLAYVLLAPTAQADCPHNNKTDHPHCNGGDPAVSYCARKQLNQTCDLPILHAIGSLLLPLTPSWRANSRDLLNPLWY